MYAGVPITAPSTVSSALIAADPGVSSTSAIALASPQSITATSPNSPTSTLAGFRSRWITPCACAYAIASATASTTRNRPSRCSNVVASRIRSLRFGPPSSFIA